MVRASRINIRYQVILLLFLCSAFNFKASNKDCPQLTINQTPKTFAIQTMTFMRSTQTTNTTQLLRFLDHYANSQCACFDTIYIVWNNQRSPQQLGIQKLDQWKKKVVFTQTPYNSLGWKYVIPESAEEQLFLALDDDIYLTCQQLLTGFNQWKQHSIGQIGPLLSYVRRSMDYDEQDQLFKYTNGKTTNQYAISLMGLAFFSRQFVDLYYSQYNQIRQIRKQVQSLNNCQDIAMNFVVSYFYPELLPRIYINQNQTKKQYQARATFGVSNSQLHFRKRDMCLNIFYQIMTFNPLRYVQYIAKDSIIQYDKTCIILQKINMYKNKVKRKTPKQIFQADKIFRQFINSESYYQQYWEKVLLQIKKKQEKSSGELTNSLKDRIELWHGIYFLGVFSIVLLTILINVLILKCLSFKYPRIKNNYSQVDEESMVLNHIK